jgi:hypothetical protein
MPQRLKEIPVRHYKLGVQVASGPKVQVGASNVLRCDASGDGSGPAGIAGHKRPFSSPFPGFRSMLTPASCQLVHFRPLSPLPATRSPHRHRHALQIVRYKERDTDMGPELSPDRAREHAPAGSDTANSSSGQPTPSGLKGALTPAHSAVGPTGGLFEKTVELLKRFEDTPGDSFNERWGKLAVAAATALLQQSSHDQL